MGPLDLLIHLLGFVAPALALGLGLAAAARLLGLDRSGGAWWVPAAVNSAAGVTVLGLGLAYFGRDGRMATYLLLVVVLATTQWAAGRGWKA